MHPHDAYAPFYQWRLDEIREGRGTSIATGRPGTSAVAPEPEKPEGPAEPPEFHFSARMPVMNAQDLDVVRLTALFVAKRGKSFMTALSQREARNYQFDFLRPQHSLYQFFTRLVDQYTILLQPENSEEALSEKGRRQELERNVKDKYHILDRAKQRAEWVKYQEHQKQKKEEEEEQERTEYAQIDWHDFVVVETVLFNEGDDQAELPPPATLGDLQSASLEQKAMMSLNPLRIEEAMPTDHDEPEYYNAYPATTEPQYPIQPSISPVLPMETTVHQPPPLPYPTPQQAAQYPPEQDDENARIFERMQARESAAAAQAAAKAGPQTSIRIRSDYVPRAQQAKRANPSGTTALCPNCGQQIPVNELEQHMRIELLDPRWKEQRAKADSRAATTNLSTIDVVNNLKRFASQRTDVFDAPVPSAAPATSSNQEMDEEEARRKRLATGNGYPPQPGLAPGYPLATPGASVPGLPPPPPGVLPTPGYPTDRNTMAAPPGVGPTVLPPGAPPQPHSINIQDQIRNIHERYASSNQPLPPGSSK